VQTATQSQKIKICNSCNRSLHISYYGVVSKSKDGYNDCCKECRNYRRRKHYNTQSVDGLTIPILNENNNQCLKKAILDGAISDFQAFNLKTKEKATFKFIRQSSSYIECRLITSECEVIFIIKEFSESAIKSLLAVLKKYSIRLFESELSYQLYIIS
jgi:hypothetical protein